MTLKRSYSSSFDLNLPAAKLSRQVANLNISEQKSNAINRNDSADMEGVDMEGVEGPNFTYVNHKDWLDAVNEVVIDDRFTKIPQHIRNPAPTKVSSSPRKSQALILYEPKSPLALTGASTVKRATAATELTDSEEQDAMEGVEEEL